VMHDGAGQCKQHIQVNQLLKQTETNGHVTNILQYNAAPSRRAHKSSGLKGASTAHNTSS
jgi:hypothetical protein